MDESLSFGSAKVIGALGVVSGAAVAVGVPCVVLAFGENVGMGSVSAVILSAIGILGGVALGIVAAFFSIVVPSEAAKRQMGEDAAPSGCGSTDPGTDREPS